METGCGESRRRVEGGGVDRGTEGGAELAKPESRPEIQKTGSGREGWGLQGALGGTWRGGT